MGFTVFSKDVRNLWVYMEAISFCRLFRHTNPTKWLQTTFEWFVSLETNHLFLVFI